MLGNLGTDVSAGAPHSRSHVGEVIGQLWLGPESAQRLAQMMPGPELGLTGTSTHGFLTPWWLVLGATPMRPSGLSSHTATLPLESYAHSDSKWGPYISSFSDGNVNEFMHMFETVLFFSKLLNFLPFLLLLC